MHARLFAARGSLISAVVAVGLAVQVTQPLNAEAATPSSPTKAASPSPTSSSSPTQHTSPTPSPTPSPKSTSSPSTNTTKVAGSPKLASAPIIPSGGSSTYSSAVLGDSPAAYYRLGETSGTTAADSSGNGHNGTISGTVTLGTPGALPSDTDTSMNFGGGMVQTPYDMTNVTALTEEAWVKTTDAGSWRTLFWDGGGNAPTFILGFSSGYCNQTVGAPFLYLGAPNLYVGIHGRTPINDGKWHYLAGVFSGTSGQQITTSQMKLYVDGVPVPTDACNQGFASANAPISGSGGTRIPYAGDFNGYLDEAAIYTTALSQTQLTNHIAASGNLPGGPTIGTPSGGANQATAAWTAPANTGGDSVTGYLVSASSGSSGVNSVSVGAQATSAPVTGLAAGTAYTFQVRAINRFGVGAASASSTAVTPTGAASTYGSTVIGDHPSGYWRLGDSGPVFADSSGNLNLGGPTGSVTQGAGGGLPNDSDKAVTLASSSSVSTNYVQPNVTAYTAEAWVNTTTTAQWATLVDDRGSPDTAHTLTLGLNNSVCSGVAGAPFFALDAAGIFIGIQTSKAINDGKWHHIVGTWSAPSGTAVAPSQFAVYVDGVAISGSSCTTGSANSPLSGIVGTALGLSLVGSEDDVAVYTSALSASQVAAHWAESGWPPGAPGNIAARAANNSAVVSWSRPTYTGQSAISGYVVSALTNGASAATQTVDASTLSVNLHGLAANTSYTFTVAGQNSYGTGVVGSSSSVAIPANTMPAAGATDTVFGNYFAWRANGFTPYTAGTSGLVSQTSLPAMSTWTVEFWMRNYGGFATTGSSAGFGVMGGQTPTTPSTVNAGLTADAGGGLHVAYPGGSFSLSNGYAGHGGQPWDHFAISYDGTTVRAFINGQLDSSAAASGAGTQAGPAGIINQTDIASLQMDELRISNVAEYTSNFTPATTAFPNTDGHTQLLWHFDDYGVTRITKQTLQQGVPLTQIRNIAYDSSGNGAHGAIYLNGQTANNYVNETDYFYSLGQGLTAAELDASGSCWLCNHPQSHTDWPVNTATGEFWHNFDDISIPGRGIPIDLNRSYGSLHAATDSPFGFGWSWAYGMSVAIDPSTQNATVTTSTGASTVFAWDMLNSQYVAQPRTIATFTRNQDGSYTLLQKDRSKLNFNASGELVSEVDKDGYTTAIAYDGNGHLHTVTDAAGRSITVTWTGSHVTGAADPAGRSVAYSYDGSGNLQQVTDIGGGITTFAYDSGHHLTTMKDPICYLDSNCPGVVNQYSGGQVTQQTDPLSRVTKFSYSTDALTSTTTVTDPKGYITVETYLNGLLMSTTRAQGTAQEATWTYDYDPVTLARSATVDPLGHTTTTSFDSQGNPLVITDALGRSTTYADYTSFNLPQHVTDASGVTTTYSYDSAGHLLSVARPLVGGSQTATTSYTYDTQHPGDLLAMTDADNKVWHYGYDANGYRNSSTDPLGDKTTWSYDSVGRLQSTVEPRGNVTGADPTQYTTSYSFDAYGKPLTVTDPLGHQSVYAYDKDENETYFKDANGHATNYTYDNDGELTKTQRPDQSLIQTTYDANGNVASQVDGLSHSVTYVYDGLNRKTSMTDALNRVTSYAYDLAGNMTSLTDAKSKTTTYKYDAGDQLVAIQYSDGVTPNVSYAYDAIGQRTSITDGTGTTSYLYDSLRRLTSNTNGAGAQVGYGYDLKGQLTSLVYPGSLGTVTRTYDDAGQLKTVADWLSHTTTFSYDAASHLTGIAYPNTVAATYTFDNAGRVTAISDQQGTNPAFINLTYGRDFIGQLTGDSSATPSTFGYDSLNRQTSGSGNLNYTYDAADRITGINVTGGNQGTLAYDNGDQLTSYTIMNGATQVQKYTYAFDANGNRTSRTDASNNTVNDGWDQANRLISYGSSATYAYNGDGLRMSKTVSGSSEAFTWDAAEGLPLLLTDGSTAFVTGPGGLPLEQIAGGSALYFHQDQLGSTLALTDGAGAVQMTKAYDAYGNVVSSTGSASTPLQYAGQYVDTESGLYYLRARYYDPAVGEFVARDPVVSATRQAYLYVADSPLNGSDRSGLWAIGWDAGWSAGIALGNGAAIDSSFGEGIVSDNSDVVVSTAGSYAGGTCDYEPCGLSRPAQRHAGDNGGVDVHAGAGGGAWISNVSSYRDLAGDAERHTATALIVTVNLDTWSAHGQSFFACGISIGKGIGLGYQQYGVHTEITSRTPALSGEAP